MKSQHSTLTDSGSLLNEPPSRARPGAVVICRAGAPSCIAVPVDGPGATFGRLPQPGVVALEDERVSREHVHIFHDGSRFRVTDRESRNGTFIDGRRINDTASSAAHGVVRVGKSLLLLVDNVLPYERGVLVSKDIVLGPQVQALYDRLGVAAAASSPVLLTGASGVGKELAAQAFHRATGREGKPFVAVNCAAIPSGLAERLFFGARRGAYSGANEDVEGYLQSADGGTLFLDEIAELDMLVQAKLLRVLETKEVTALGAARARKVDVRLCAATLRDLRQLVSEGTFREDLYFRIGRPEERLPSLAERPEEIPWLAERAVQRISPSLSASVGLIEACIARAWPGNVRELLTELRLAAQIALAAGRDLVRIQDLAPRAGLPLEATSPPPASTPSPTSVPKQRVSIAVLERESVEQALRESGGNITRAATALGVHRTQLRRWLTKNRIAGPGES